MSRRITKKEQQRQTKGAGVMIFMLVIFASFAVYQGIKANNAEQKTKVIIVDDSRTKESEKSNHALNTNADKDLDVTDNTSNTNEEVDEEPIEKENAIGGPDEDVNKELQNTTRYTNDEQDFSLLLPNGWTSNEADSGRVGLLPAGSVASLQYEGDIVVNVKQNPKKLSLKEYYNGINDVALFTDALGGSKPFEVNGLDAFLFKEVEGYVPSNVAVVDTGDTFIEITDTGMRHVDDGVFDAIIYSVK